MERVCSVEGCGPIPNGKKSRRGMCPRHYQAWHRNEAGYKPKRREPKTLAIAPLLRYAERRGVALGLTGERVHRDLVDDIACHKFQVHPSFIYGDDWWRANAA